MNGRECARKKINKKSKVSCIGSQLLKFSASGNAKRSRKKQRNELQTRFTDSAAECRALSANEFRFTAGLLYTGKKGRATHVTCHDSVTEAKVSIDKH